MAPCLRSRQKSRAAYTWTTVPDSFGVARNSVVGAAVALIRRMPRRRSRTRHDSSDSADVLVAGVSAVAAAFPVLALAVGDFLFADPRGAKLHWNVYRCGDAPQSGSGKAAANPPTGEARVIPSAILPLLLLEQHSAKLAESFRWVDENLRPEMGNGPPRLTGPFPCR